MAKRLQNFEIYAGDARKIDFDVKDDAGAAVDLTGMTFTWVATKHRTLIPIITKTTANGGVTIVGPAANGNVEVAIGGGDSDLLTDIIYYHQCVMKDSAGNETTVLTGYITVLRRKGTA